MILLSMCMACTHTQCSAWPSLETHGATYALRALGRLSGGAPPHACSNALIVVSGPAAKQRPVGGQAEPGHTQQGARAPADPSAPRGKHRVWGGLGVGAPATCPCPRTHMSIPCLPPGSGPHGIRLAAPPCFTSSGLLGIRAQPSSPSYSGMVQTHMIRKMSCARRLSGAGLLATVGHRAPLEP